MIDWLAFTFWSWLAFTLGFVGGCFWNSDAYERGRRDAERGRTDW